MILSTILTLVFFLMAAYTLTFVGGRLAGWLLLLCYAVAVFVVWRPETTTALALFLGIGRGVDLILILLSVIIINVILFLVRHIYAMHQQLTQLARSVAINNATPPCAPTVGSDAHGQSHGRGRGATAPLSPPSVSVHQGHVKRSRF